MIQFLSNQLKANKGKLPITFRPIGGKWHRGVLVGIDQLGMVVAMGKGQASVLPWNGVAVINIGGGGQAGTATKQGAKDGELAAEKPADKPAVAAKNGKDSKAGK